MPKLPRNLDDLAATQAKNLTETRKVASEHLTECEALLGLFADIQEVESGPRHGVQWPAMRTLLSQTWFYLSDAVLAAASTSGYKVELLARAAIESIVYAIRVYDSEEAAKAWLGRHKGAVARVTEIIKEDPTSDFRKALVQNDEYQKRARDQFDRSEWSKSLRKVLATMPAGKAIKAELHLRYDIAVQMGAHPSWMGQEQFSTRSPGSEPGASRYESWMFHGNADIAGNQLEQLAQLCLYVLVIVAGLLPEEANVANTLEKLQKLYPNHLQPVAGAAAGQENADDSPPEPTEQGPDAAATSEDP